MYSDRVFICQSSQGFRIRNTFHQIKLYEDFCRFDLWINAHMFTDQFLFRKSFIEKKNYRANNWLDKETFWALISLGVKLKMMCFCFLDLFFIFFICDLHDFSLTSQSVNQNFILIYKRPLIVVLMWVYVGPINIVHISWMFNAGLFVGYSIY